MLIKSISIALKNNFFMILMFIYEKFISLDLIYCLNHIFNTVKKVRSASREEALVLITNQYMCDFDNNVENMYIP